jgi:glutamate/tyrosine decarboxylase-like PLP-dependent enzyme
MPAEKVKWEKILEEKILPAFPMPWASHGADRRFEDYIKRTLHHLDKLKKPEGEEAVYLGKPDVWIHDKQSLQQCRENSHVPEEGEQIEEVTKGIVNFFNGMVDWGHPKMAMNVVPPSTLPSIAANLVSAVLNPNLIEEEYCVNVAASEVEAIAMCAEFAGYDPAKADGIFTFGGLGTWFYAAKMGLTKALGKESRYTGIRKDAQILTSQVAHFSKVNCSDWVGVGMNNLRDIPLNEDNSMNLDELRKTMAECHKAGKPVALINCTTGTTDAFAVDDVRGVVEIRDEFVKKYNLDYKPHVHADAVIGWAWMAYRNYDFQANPLGLSPGLKDDLYQVAAKFKYLHYADSIGLDFHKSGYTPYISSLFLLKNGNDFELLKRPAGEEAYLFHFGAYNPGEYSLESSRAASGSLAAWANLKLFGIEGYQVMLARLVDVERAIRKDINSRQDMVVVNPDDHGFVTLYRVYPEGTDAVETYKAEFSGEMDDKLAEHNKYILAFSTEVNRRQREENGPFLSFTSNHRVNKNGKPVAALKVFPMTPYADASTMKEVMAGIIAAKENVDMNWKE